MQMKVNFGTLSSPSSEAVPIRSDCFRLALLGDFSARGNSRRLAAGDELARRKPMRVDVDNLDQLLERMQVNLQLQLPGSEGAVTVKISELDDFHPDRLFEQLELFAELASLRRRLQNPAACGDAVEELSPWLNSPVEQEGGRSGPEGRGVDVPDGSLDDFAQLMGLTTVEQQAADSVARLARQLVAPYVLPTASPHQAEMVSAVDSALSASMRAVLHHPDFRATESLWRGVDMLTRRLETARTLQIVLYDISAEELAADLSSVEQLEASGLYQLLVEQPASEAEHGPLSLIVGNYTFSQQPGHAALLGRLAKIAAAGGVPVAAGINVQAEQLDAVDPSAGIAWSELQQLPASKQLRLVTPRYLQRVPYGKRTSPIDSFAFEELESSSDLSGLLWGNSALLLGLKLAQAFHAGGGRSAAKNAVVSDLPFYWYVDSDGDQAPVPCTETALSERQIEQLDLQGIIPVIATRGQPEVRLGIGGY